METGITGDGAMRRPDSAGRDSGDSGDPSYHPLSGRLMRELRPPMQNLPGTPAAILERAMACCTPVSCGYHLGNRTFKQRQDDWDEERRGWTGLS